MADWNRADSLFRFVQVRAPQGPQGPKSSLIPRIRTYFPDNPTELHGALAAARADGSLNDVIAAATRFLGSADRSEWNDVPFKSSLADSLPFIAKLDAYLSTARDTPTPKDLERALVERLPAADDVIDWNAVLDSLAAEWRAFGDAITAASITPAATARHQSQLSRALRVLCLLREIIDAGWRAPERPRGPVPKALADLITAERIAQVLVDALILLPPDVFPLPRLASLASPMTEAAPARLARPLGEQAIKPRSPGTAIQADGAMRVRVVRAAEDLARVMHRAAARPGKLPTIADVRPLLSPEERELLAALSIQEASSVPAAIAELDRMALRLPGGELVAAPSARHAALAVLNERRRWTAGTGTIDAWGDWNIQNLTRTPVVGDLHVVQQELLRYEAGEIAHIETVLDGEKRVHVHQFKELMERETLTVSEREEERTHDNQTTDRQEMERETTRESQLEAQFQAGVTVSASYGAMKLDANTQFAVATSSSESNRNASKYSKEVVDRASERVKQRRLEQQRSLTRRELLERNRHEYDNDSGEHIVGIFRWVDKVYEAATFNYGLRMMLDVTVPDPGAYWQYAKALEAANSVSATPPPPLKVFDSAIGGQRDLVASDIGVLVTIEQLAATFRVGGLQPPPARWVSAGTTMKNEADPPADKNAKDQQQLHTKDDKLKIPKGYVPAWYTATVNLMSNPDQQDYIINNSGWRNKYSGSIGAGPDGTNLPFWATFDYNIIGANSLSVGPFVDVLTAGIPNVVTHTFREAQVDNTVPLGASGDLGEEGIVPVALSVIGSPTFAATITVVCERTESAFRAWQLEQYATVVTQWESWNDEFEAAVREAERSSRTRNGTGTTMNPLQGDTAIETEMRRLFLQMLGVPALGRGDAILTPGDTSDPTNPKPPVLQTSAAAIAGRIVQFVEQAFEWPQLAYWLYPYYWKGEADWPPAMVLQNADPAFGNFLRAGSVRIVVPVRPGFEIAVSHHLGVNPPLPWQASTPPIVDDDPYLSIAEEIKSAQTPDHPPVRIDTPWIVRLPTTLIYLQDGSDLPIFRQPTVLTPVTP